MRREGGGLRHYVHIGTGNYHAKTARLYEDFGLFTCDPALAADVAELFNALTGAARSPGYRKAIVAPDHMRDWFLEEVRKTIEARLAGQEARIVLKMNSLVDARSIRALYVASQAGVQVDLNMRGICCLRPGVPGVSDNIRVVSVVGRFLEHSRIYGFVRGDERRYWIGSGDLMPRNLDTRVELLAPVEDPALRSELEDTLERCLADDTFAWELETDGSWTRRPGQDTLGAPRAHGARGELRPSTDLSASTRPADSRTRARKPGERRATREQPREHLVPARGARSSGSGPRRRGPSVRRRRLRPSGPARPRPRGCP